MNRKMSTGIVMATFVFLSLSALAQENSSMELQAAVAEGKQMYWNERAWENAVEDSRVKMIKRSFFNDGIPYRAGNQIKVVFFSTKNGLLVVATAVSDTACHKKPVVSFVKRPPTALELDLYRMRVGILEATIKDSASFPYLPNTQFLVRPIVSAFGRKVYVITRSRLSGVMMFGHDFQFSFHGKSDSVTARPLHSTVIVHKFDTLKCSDLDVDFAAHGHEKELSDDITATDIFTIMYYKRLANWRDYLIAGNSNMSLWDCEKNVLTKMGREEFIAKYLNRLYHGNKMIEIPPAGEEVIAY